MVLRPAAPETKVAGLHGGDDESPLRGEFQTRYLRVSVWLFYIFLDRGFGCFSLNLFELTVLGKGEDVSF